MVIEEAVDLASADKRFPRLIRPTERGLGDAEPEVSVPDGRDEQTTCGNAIHQGDELPRHRLRLTAASGSRQEPGQAAATVVYTGGDERLGRRVHGSRAGAVG